MYLIKHNKKLVYNAVIVLVAGCILIALILYAVQFIELRWYNIVIIALPSLLCIAVSLLLLGQFDKYNEKRLSNKLTKILKNKDVLLLKLKNYVSKIEVWHNSMYEMFEHQKDVVNQLEKEIRQCSNKSELELFLFMKYYNEKYVVLAKDYVLCFKEHFEAEVKYLSGYVVDEDEFKEICESHKRKEKELCNTIEKHIKILKDVEEQFDGIVLSLAEKKSVIGILYREYKLSNYKIFDEYTEGCRKWCIDSKCSVDKILDCVQKEKNIKAKIKRYIVKKRATLLSTDVVRGSVSLTCK